MIPNKASIAPALVLAGTTASARFLSVDPVAADTTTGVNLNRYWYANDNPYKNIDSDARDCITVGKQVNCSAMVTGSHIRVKFSFPAPTGFPAHINSSESNYHHYDIGMSAGPGSAHLANALRQTVVTDPTPGVDKPASQNGTPNNASPTTGFLGMAGKSRRARSNPTRDVPKQYDRGQCDPSRSSVVSRLRSTDRDNRKRSRDDSKRW